MKLPYEKKLELEERAVRLAHELADKLEEIVHEKLNESEGDAIIQMLLYAELSAWYMSAHLAVCQANGMKSPTEGLINDIVRNALVKFNNYKIIQERH